jgi:hypothetical protein
MKIKSIVELQSESQLLLRNFHKTSTFHEEGSLSKSISAIGFSNKNEISNEYINTLNDISLNYGLLSDHFKTF